MATAPTPGKSPGTTAHVEAVDNARKIMRMTVRGETRHLAIGNIPMGERLIVRKATGLPVEAFVGEDKIGEDSLVVLWWLAARADGNTHYTWKQACEDWPDDLSDDDVEAEVLDADDPSLRADDPES